MAKKKRSKRAATTARWKAFERKVGKWIGVRRTPLSGRNSGHDTGSDTLHKELYMEAKTVEKNAGSNAWVFKLLCDLKPGDVMEFDDDLIGIHSSGEHNGKVVFPSIDEIDTLVYNNAWDNAEEEGKLPLLALKVKGKRGFWLVGAECDVMRAFEIHEEVEEAKNEK